MVRFFRWLVITTSLIAVIAAILSDWAVWLKVLALVIEAFILILEAKHANKNR